MIYAIKFLHPYYTFEFLFRSKKYIFQAAQKIALNYQCNCDKKILKNNLINCKLLYHCFKNKVTLKNMHKRAALIFLFIYLKNDANICTWTFNVLRSVNLQYAYTVS